MQTRKDILPKLTALYTDYVDTFRVGGVLPSMMELKRIHTEQVVENARLIAEGEGFDAHATDVCVVAALLHDTGRYEQIRTYGTFQDSKSVDHAVFSHAIVKEKGWLACCAARDRKTILDAVLFHNRRDLPKGLDRLTRMVAQTVRDADKLDIFRVLEDQIATTDWRHDCTAFWNLPTTARPSPEVVSAILARRPVDYQHICSLADFVLIQVGWMASGLSFATTRRLCAARGHLAFRRDFLHELSDDPVVDQVCGCVPDEFGPKDAARFLQRALELAARGEGHTRPNPPVGAVLVRDGAIIGEGWHRKAGMDHAEVAAIRAARRLGRQTEGATIFVTLEPCSRPGRVGACTDALAAAGIRQVFFAVPDPNPANWGRARRVLARSGITCRCLATDRTLRSGEGTEHMRTCVRRAKELIAPFAKHVTTGLPFVTVKLAMSLDGKISDDAGNAKWISSAVSRRLTGRERERVDAILVGAETVRKDDPSLLSHGRRNDDLIRVVVSRSGRVPKTAQIFTDGRNRTLVFRDARTALEELGRMGVMHVLCEGGLTLARSLADGGLVDRWISVVSPIVIGTQPIDRAQRLRLIEAGIADPVAGDRIARYERI